MTYLATIRNPGMGRTILLIIAVPIEIISYADDVTDRLGWINLPNRRDVVVGWGRHNDNFYEFINYKLLLGHKR